MERTEFIILMDTLKKILKTKRIRYQQVAEHLEISEVTVKRMFSGQPTTITRIMEICDLAEVSFFELVALAAKPSEEASFLSPEQEQHFADYPAHYAIFKELAKGRSPEVVQKEWDLTDEKFFRLLRSLEGLGILEVLPEKKVHMRIKGLVRINENGPIARSIVFPQNISFLEQVQENVRDHDVCYHSVECPLTPSQVKEMVAEIHALGRKYRILSQQGLHVRRPDAVTTVRWLFAFAPYRTDWKQYPI